MNWCAELGTVLANEEVVDGKSEIGGFPVVRRPMRQWMLRITAYAERLIDELDGLDSTGRQVQAKGLRQRAGPGPGRQDHDIGMIDAAGGVDGGGVVPGRRAGGA